MTYAQNDEDEKLQETLKIVKELINSYFKREHKLILDIEEEWKQEEKDVKNKLQEKVNYPRIYSNSWYAFRELKSFWDELKQKLGVKE